MLHELQREFAAAMFETRAGVVARVRPGRFPAEQHLQIYRHNIVTTLTVALGAVYPVVEKLVDSRFFGYAAHEYLRDHRPLSANLHDFGGEFADFLAGFPPVTTLPYLPDVAHLEWARHRAVHAAEASIFDPAALAAVAVEDQAQLRFGLHPSAQLVSSNYPIVRIFEASKDGFDGNPAVDLNAGGVQALVIRRGLKIGIEPLAAGTAALLAAFIRNRPLVEALELALVAQPDFDLNTVLAEHVQRGTIVRVHPG